MTVLVGYSGNRIPDTAILRVHFIYLEKQMITEFYMQLTWCQVDGCIKHPLKYFW